MFQKSSKNNSTESVSINLIGNGTAITGDVKSIGDIRIDGILNGNITINGKLVIGSTGKIEGNIEGLFYQIASNIFPGKGQITPFNSIFNKIPEIL